MKVIPETRRVQ